MPMYRFHMRARTNKDTQGAADLVRYLRREGEFAPKSTARDADVDYMTRQSADTAHHDDLVGEPLVANLPAWAAGNAGTYFARASEQERMNGQYAIALQIALPCELSHEQQMRLAQDFLEATMPRNPYLVVKHEPVTDGQAQPHLHILVGPRLDDGIARSPEQHFRRYNPEHPARGGAPKDRFWNQRQAPRQLRMAFSDLANYHLERAGVIERIDPRKLQDRGITRSRIQWEKDETGAHKILHRPSAATLAKEQAKAAATWEQRKLYKGLGTVHDIPREEMVLLVRQWTREYERGHQLPRVSTTEVIAWYEKEAQRVAQEQEALAHRLTQLERAQRGELRAHELHAVLHSGDQPVRQGLRARIFEDELPGYRY